MLINLKENIDELTIEDICRGAVLNDEVSIFVLKDAARYLGIGISNLVNILNPTNIVVVGEIFQDNHEVIETLTEIVGKRSMNLPKKRMIITKSALGKEAAVIGAVTLVIKELYSGNETLIK